MVHLEKGFWYYGINDTQFSLTNSHLLPLSYLTLFKPLSKSLSTSSLLLLFPLPPRVSLPPPCTSHHLKHCRANVDRVEAAYVYKHTIFKWFILYINGSLYINGLLGEEEGSPISILIHKRHTYPSLPLFECPLPIHTNPINLFI